jgi:hypothetical protein
LPSSRETDFFRRVFIVLRGLLVELELKLENRLSAYVALTVVVISVFMSLCDVKDGNLVDLMLHTDVKTVDTWNEYQAERIKMHSDVNDVAILQVNSQIQGADKARALAERQRLSASAAGYARSSGLLARQAKSFETTYEKAELLHNQFDTTDAFCAIALAVAAVAALANYLPLLFAAWIFGAVGIIAGTAGLFGMVLSPLLLGSMLG